MSRSTSARSNEITPPITTSLNDFDPTTPVGEYIEQIAGCSGGGITPSDTDPEIAGCADPGEADAYARGDHVHPAEVVVKDLMLQDVFFPISYRAESQNYTIPASLGNRGIRIDEDPSAYILYDISSNAPNGRVICYFSRQTYEYNNNATGVTNLTFAGATPSASNVVSVTPSPSIIAHGKEITYLPSKGRVILTGELEVRDGAGTCANVKTSGITIGNNANVGGKVIMQQGAFMSSDWASCNSSIPAFFRNAQAAVLPGMGTSPFSSDYEIIRKGDVAQNQSVGVVKIGTNIKVDAAGTISVKDGTVSQKGVVQLTNTLINGGNMYSTSSTTAVTPNAVSKAIRYMMLGRGSTISNLFDRAVQHTFVQGSSGSAPHHYFALPGTPADTNLVKDFIFDVEMRQTEPTNSVIDFYGRNIGWAAAIAEGEDWTDMMTVMPGQRVRFYFTETGFMTNGQERLPIYLVARQDVALVVSSSQAPL